MTRATPEKYRRAQEVEKQWIEDTRKAAAYYKHPKPGTVHQARNYAEVRVTELGTELAKAMRRIEELEQELEKKGQS